jgi:hypothetical protein
MGHGISMNNNFSRVRTLTISADHVAKVISKEDILLPARHAPHMDKTIAGTAGVRVIKSQRDATITAHEAITPGGKMRQPGVALINEIIANMSTSSVGVMNRKTIRPAHHLSVLKATTNSLPTRLLPTSKRMGNQNNQRVNKLGNIGRCHRNKGRDRIFSSQRKDTLHTCPMAVS